MHKNMKRKMMRDCLEVNEGTGINYEIPPKNFKVEVTDEKERRKMFSKIVNEEMLSSGWNKQKIGDKRDICKSNNQKKAAN